MAKALALHRTTLRHCRHILWVAHCRRRVTGGRRRRQRTGLGPDDAAAQGRDEGGARRRRSVSVSNRSRRNALPRPQPHTRARADRQAGSPPSAMPRRSPPPSRSPRCAANMSPPPLQGHDRGAGVGVAGPSAGTHETERVLVLRERVARAHQVALGGSARGRRSVLRRSRGSPTFKRGCRSWPANTARSSCRPPIRCSRES